MSAIPDDFIKKTSALSEEVTRPFANSRKLYVEGSRPDIRVPIREVEQTPTTTNGANEPNPPIYLYDTSGPYCDPDARIDLLKGLREVRTDWILERDDTEQLDGPTSEYGKERQHAPELANLRFEHIRAGCNHGCGIRHMLKHFHAGDRIEGAGHLFGELLGGKTSIVDLQSRLQQMQSRDLQWGLAHVDAGDVGTARRHRFGQDATSTTDVEHLLPFEADACIDIVQAQRVDLVQRLELAVRIPPAFGQLLELVDFAVIDIDCRHFGRLALTTVQHYMAVDRSDHGLLAVAIDDAVDLLLVGAKQRPL